MMRRAPLGTLVGLGAVAIVGAAAARAQAPEAAATPGAESAPAEPDGAGAPPCVASCESIAAAGELSPGVSELGCLVRVCHEDARRLYERSDFATALRSLDHIEQWVEFSPAYQMDRGLVLYGLRRFDDAIASFDAVLEVYRESVRASAQRAHALVRLGRLPEARAQFGKMLEFEAADAEYNGLDTRSYLEGNLAVLRLAEGDLDGARAGLQAALDRDPRNELARTYRDRILPEFEAGRAAPEAVVRLVAGFEELALRRPNGALREFSAVLSEWPEFKLGYVVVADTQRRYRDYAGCETTLQVALGRFPDDTRLLVERIRCTLMRHGVDADASVASIAELKRLAERDPDDPMVREILLLLDR